MAVAPAIGAGVGLIGGIANISAKNKAADAQRAQLSAQSYQQAQQQIANEASLRAQQELAMAEYNNGVLSRMAQFYQADFGLQAQQQLAAINAQQQAYAVKANQLEQALGAGQAADQLQRQAASIDIGADQRRQATDAMVAGIAEQGTQALNEQQQQLTAEQRKQLSLEASGKLRTSSNETAKGRILREQVATALSLGADMDKAQVLAAMQAFNEDQLTDIGQRLGLLDNAASAESIAANLRMLGISTDAALQNIDANSANTQAALGFARQNNLVSSQLDAQNAADAYRAQDYSLGVQRSIGAASANQVASYNRQAMNSVKGASFFDYLNTGVTAFGAVSPMLYQRPTFSTPQQPQSRPNNYSGFPTVYSNVG